MDIWITFVQEHILSRYHDRSVSEKAIFESRGRAFAVLYSCCKVQLCGDDYTHMNVCAIHVKFLFVCTNPACLRHGNNLFKTKRTSRVASRKKFFPCRKQAHALTHKTTHQPRYIVIPSLYDRICVCCVSCRDEYICISTELTRRCMTPMNVCVTVCRVSCVCCVCPLASCMICVFACGAQQAMKQQSLEQQAIAGMGSDDITGGDEGKGLGPSTQRFQPMCALTMAGNCLAFQEAIGTAGGGCVALTGQGLCHPRAWIEPLFTWREQLFATAAASSVPSQESFCPFVLASVCKAWRLHVLALISIDEEKGRTTLEIDRKTRMELLKRNQTMLVGDEVQDVHVEVITGECTSRARTVTHCVLFVMCSPLNTVGCAAKGTFEAGARGGEGL